MFEFGPIKRLFDQVHDLALGENQPTRRSNPSGWYVVRSLAYCLGDNDRGFFYAYLSQLMNNNRFSNQVFKLDSLVAETSNEDPLPTAELDEHDELIFKLPQGHSVTASVLTSRMEFSTNIFPNAPLMRVAINPVGFWTVNVTRQPSLLVPPKEAIRHYFSKGGRNHLITGNANIPLSYLRDF